MYSLWSNYVYIHRELWHYSRKPVLFQALEIVSQVLTGFFGLLAPRHLFQECKRLLIMNKMHQMIRAHNRHILFSEDSLCLLTVRQDNLNNFALLQVFPADLTITQHLN